MDADMDNTPGFVAATRTPYTLELTPAQLKITHAALRVMLDGNGHQHDVRRVLQTVLGKLPDDEQIRAINFGAELRRERRESDPRNTVERPAAP